MAGSLAFNAVEVWGAMREPCLVLVVVVVGIYRKIYDFYWFCDGFLMDCWLIFNWFLSSNKPQTKPKWLPSYPQTTTTATTTTIGKYRKHKGKIRENNKILKIFEKSKKIPVGLPGYPRGLPGATGFFFDFSIVFLFFLCFSWYFLYLSLHFLIVVVVVYLGVVLGIVLAIVVAAFISNWSDEEGMMRPSSSKPCWQWFSTGRKHSTRFGL